MTGQSQPANWVGWRRLLELGERLMAAPTVRAKCDLIVATAAHLLGGQADIWLAESFHRLLSREGSPPFPPTPPSTLMQSALNRRQEVYGNDLEDGSHPSAVAVPLLVEDAALGVLQIDRLESFFSEPEVDLFKGIGAQLAIALQATLQVETERWRIEQLSLVRRVSAQVAQVLDLDELFPRVADIILDSFEYYYVALFTLEPGQEALRLRASAGPVRTETEKEWRPRPMLRVRLGDGIIGHVAQSGQEILANDVNLEPRYRHEDALPETRSEVALPLTIENRVLGVLDVQSDQPHDFDETDMLVLRALAHNISFAVEDARLYGDLRRRADQLLAVADVGRAVASILDLEVLLDQVVTLIHHRFGYPFVHLFMVNPGRCQVVYQAGSGRRSQMIKTQGLIYDLDDPEGIIPWVARHGQTVLANDVDRDPRYRPSGLPSTSTRAELAVPLVFAGEVLGVLDVQSDRLFAFSDDDRFLFEALADNVAIAIRNASLYRSERWRRQVADSLREVAGLLSAGLAINQVLDAILSELERTLPCDAAAIWLLGDEDLQNSRVGAALQEKGLDVKKLQLAAVRGYTAEEMLHIEGFEPETIQWFEQALNTDQPTIRSPHSPFEPLGAALAFPPEYSAIAAPLRVADRRLGLLVLIHRASGRYGAESRAMTAAFASYAAVAIENTHLYQSAQEQAWMSTVLLQVAEATRSLSSLDQVLEAVVRLLPIFVGAEWCVVFLWDEEQRSFRLAQAYGIPGIAEGADGHTLGQARRYAPGDFPLLDAIRESDEFLTLEAFSGWRDLIPSGFAEDFIDSLSDATQQINSRHIEGESHSLLALPLSVQGKVLGVMLMEETSLSSSFRERRREIIAGISQQAALAVQNDLLQKEMAERERLEQELHLAHQIQQAFMPDRLPDLPGWDLAFEWQAARQVAGDFYDFFKLPGARLGLVIADVADKGMPAALFMTLTRTLVRAAALEDESPADVLARANDLLVPDAQQGMFVTAFYAVLSLETGRLTYASAGHNPPLLLDSRTQELKRLVKGGMALGVMEGTSLKEHAACLEPGDSLIMYTDGITEAFSPKGDVYGEEQLWATIQAADCASAQTILDAIHRSVYAFLGEGPPSDDITMMVIRRLDS